MAEMRKLLTSEGSLQKRSVEKLTRLAQKKTKLVQKLNIRAGIVPAMYESESLIVYV